VILQRIDVNGIANTAATNSMEVKSTETQIRNSSFFAANLQTMIHIINCFWIENS